MRRIATLVVGVLLVASGTALAQDKGGVSGGYRLLRLSGEDSLNISTGWYFDVTGHVTDVFSVVGDLGGSYKSESESFGGVTATVDAKIHTFQAGVKFRASMVSPKAVPFGQVLFGAGRGSFTAEVAGTLFDESSTDPIMTVGGGVDVIGGGAVGVRAQVGWLRIFEEGGGSNAFQFSIGATIGF